ncbi:ferredoxin--NADP reductase [Mucilaginibacter terrae]|uniref:ferredoxin--NADP reductase n=1 Tax=Mucilaginibacter terrae TaxID=1955052 RepID=UPI003625E01A
MYTLKIDKIFQETEDAVTLSFKQPGLKKVKYLPGQYLSVIFRINGRRYVRPYSLSSAPGVDATLNITIKRVPGGIVSNHIVDKLSVGDIVEVMAPMGDFTIENAEISAESRIMLWGVGSGITPLMSIAKYALHNKLCSHVTMIYGNRNHESVIMKDNIADLQKLYPETFAVWHFHTKLVVDPSKPNIIQGRINPEKVLSVLSKETDLKHTSHFICGPTGLKESVKQELLKQGVLSNRIFSEDFEVVRDPKSFEDIITRTVQINFNNVVYQVEVAKGKSILEAGLDSLIEIPYSCQTGNCSMCKGIIVKGDVKVLGVKSNDILLNANEKLLCCSFPLTNDVEVLIN